MFARDLAPYPQQTTTPTQRPKSPAAPTREERLKWLKESRVKFKTPHTRQRTFLEDVAIRTAPGPMPNPVLDLEEEQYAEKRRMLDAKSVYWSPQHRRRGWQELPDSYARSANDHIGLMHRSCAEGEYERVGRHTAHETESCAWQQRVLHPPSHLAQIPKEGVIASYVEPIRRKEGAYALATKRRVETRTAYMQEQRGRGVHGRGYMTTSVDGSLHRMQVPFVPVRDAASTVLSLSLSAAAAAVRPGVKSRSKRKDDGVPTMFPRDQAGFRVVVVFRPANNRKPHEEGYIPADVVHVMKIFRAFGLVVWADVTGLRKGGMVEMSQAIDESDAVALCLTDDFMQSSNCCIDAQYAKMQKRYLLPLDMSAGPIDEWISDVVAAYEMFDFAPPLTPAKAVVETEFILQQLKRIPVAGDAMHE